MSNQPRFGKFVDDFYNKSNHRKNNQEEVMVQYYTDELDKPKHKIVDPQLFAKGREILGNIISRRMKTSGGTDIDWLIEHNGGFIILELKMFSDDRIFITRAQMLAYERLYEKLEKCYLFFIGHDDINFTKLEDPVWIFDMKKWKASVTTRIEAKFTDPNYSNKELDGYIIEREYMEKIDVKRLRDRIDFAWNEFDYSKK